MRHIGFSVGLFIVLFAFTIAQGQESKVVVAPTQEDCSPNQDGLYERTAVLGFLAKTLNESIPEFRGFDPGGFQVKAERAKNFFVYDLVDIANKQTSTQCVQLIDNHVYHFAPLHVPYSFSHILILEHGSMKVFRSINCKGRGDTIESVIEYLKKRFTDKSDADGLIDRLRKYRKFGYYFTVDDDVIRCDSVHP